MRDPQPALDRAEPIESDALGGVAHAHDGLLVSCGLSIPTREILTGPGVVDATNIKSTMAGAKGGTR
jgi:hypothetical protein